MLGLKRFDMTYQAKVIAGGKIVIPAELRRAMGIIDGDSLVIEQAADGTLVIKTYAQLIREGQAEMRAMVGDDFTVDQFLAERRADWAED
jgi:AbrB family transcriptional regulator, stage V sporulation protein T